jgi:hypothetical protein
VAPKDCHFESEFFMVNTGIKSIELFGSLLIPFKEKTVLGVPQPDAGRRSPIDHKLRHDYRWVASAPTMDLVSKIFAYVTAKSVPVIVRASGQGLLKRSSLTQPLWCGGRFGAKDPRADHR